MRGLKYAIINSTLAYLGPGILEGCDSELKYSVHVELILRYLTRSSLIAGDVLVLVVTWRKTFPLWLQARKANISSPSVTTCLLRDGSWYFMVFAVINLLQMVLPNEDAGDTYVSILISNFPPLLINRFMINLRSTITDTPSRSFSGPHDATLSFAPICMLDSVLGNIGQPLDDGSELDDGDDHQYPAEHTGMANDVDIGAKDNSAKGVRSTHADDIPLSVL